jgi:hypothetical protein
MTAITGDEADATIWSILLIKFFLIKEESPSQLEGSALMVRSKTGLEMVVIWESLRAQP